MYNNIELLFRMYDQIHIVIQRNPCKFTNSFCHIFSIQNLDDHINPTCRRLQIQEFVPSIFVHFYDITRRSGRHTVDESYHHSHFKIFFVSVGFFHNCISILVIRLANVVKNYQFSKKNAQKKLSRVYFLCRSIFVML